MSSGPPTSGGGATIQRPRLTVPKTSLVRAFPRVRPSAGGNHVVQFVESHVRQSKGRWAGRPLLFEPYQKDFIHQVFRTDRMGRRIHREALWGLPRKNGKSTSLASLGLYLLIADEEPGPEVYAAAASKDQARVVFEEARRMVEASPVLMDHLVVRRNHIEFPEEDGVFRVVSADAPRLHGLNPSGVVIDELHAHKNPELYYALTTGSMAREQPLFITITTAGYDRETILWEVFERGLAGEDPDFLFWWLGASDDADWSDRRLWKAVNPASWITEEDLEREFRRLPLGVFARLHLNAWTSTEELWLPLGAWASCGGKVTIPLGAEVFVGVDIGLRHDSSAVALVWHDEANDEFHVDVRIFDPPEGGGKLNLAGVENYLDELAGKYRVREVAYDPHFFQRSAEDLGDRMNMVEFPQHNALMVPASQNAYDLIAEGKIVHAGDGELARHVQAAAVRETERGWRIAKAKSRQRIDGLVALVMALHRAVTLGSQDEPDVIFV